MRKKRFNKKYKIYTRKKCHNNINKKSVKAELMSLLYNIFFITFLMLFLKLFGLNNFDSLVFAVISRLAFLSVGLIIGNTKKKKIY